MPGRGNAGRGCHDCASPRLGSEPSRGDWPSVSSGGAPWPAGCCAGSSATVAIDVVTALNALSAEHRRVLVLHEMVGMSVREVAAETGVAEGTVKSRLSRARERLGVALGPEYLAGPAPAGADVLVREEEGR
jgi:DNA-directed RNA polymerase specialized sigma24 family protein